MVAIFALTALVSASLLFLIQPLFAKMALPLLGGAPNVWIICMVFFQAMLLAGYAYAYLSARWLSMSGQVSLHALIVLAPLLVLPIGIGASAAPPGDANPTLWLLSLLTVTVGLPFLAVSASAPLLQRWFSLGFHAHSADPYFLYAASNAGSVAGLAAYPLLLEPLLKLGRQSQLWGGGYAIFVGLISVCAWLALRRAAAGATSPESAPTELPLHLSADGGRWRQRLWWIALAFVPSSLTLGVTTVLTTDIAAVPLLWVIPLLIYLASYILVFARERRYSLLLLQKAFPITVLTSVSLIVTGATQPVALIILIHLFTLFIVAMLCHGHLADLRPDVARLTEFYLCVSIGGVLGGVFNALVAPELFSRTTEYPLIIVFACMLHALRLQRRKGALERKLDRSAIEAKPQVLALSDVVLASLVGVLTMGVIFFAAQLPEPARAFRILLIAGVPMMFAFLLSKRLLRFAFCVAAILVAGAFNDFDQGRQLEAERTFFGIHRVTRLNSGTNEEGPRYAVNMLYHGSTMHGSQMVDPDSGTPAAPLIPLVYYHRNGPVGDALFAMQRGDASVDVGLVGLGAGAMAAYGRAGEHYTFFELDPTVARIAEDPRYFSYLAAARERRVDVEVVLGDARLRLEKIPDASFDILVLDAFSSDAVPLHLLSREALVLYLSKLRPGGLLAFHLSNRHLELRDAVNRVALNLDLHTLWRSDVNRSTARLDQIMRRNSEWLLAARLRRDVVRVAAARPAAGWQFIKADRSLHVWTDNFSDIWSVFKW
ncbi:MAG TPA: fused MFS/spermidine synthase [Gammaproteobacteria bacterium]|nr:fused MFS/spermidine synthase [Gammaproteobacteria bacterium]